MIRTEAITVRDPRNNRKTYVLRSPYLWLTPVFRPFATQTTHAEMPGVDKSGLEITVDNGELTIVRHRRTEGNSGEPVYREIRHNDLRRVYELDPAIDTTSI